MAQNKPNDDGSPNSKMLTPRKNFETNHLTNGMNPWYHENDRLMEEYLSIRQGKESDRLSVPKRTNSKWDDQVAYVKNANNMMNSSHLENYNTCKKQVRTEKVSRNLKKRNKTEMGHNKKMDF